MSSIGSSLRNGAARGYVRALRRALRQMQRLRRFGRAEDGATAVEFAIVATPFLALLFAIIETALVFLAQQTLETATADSARMIMTGQAQKANFDAAKFKQDICSRIAALFDCANGIVVDVRTAASFSAANTGRPLDANHNLVNNFTFNPGGASEIVIVRVMYQWPLLVPTFGYSLADMGNGKRLLMATSAFRNEPF